MKSSEYTIVRYLLRLLTVTEILGRFSWANGTAEWNYLYLPWIARDIFLLLCHYLRIEFRFQTPNKLRKIVLIVLRFSEGDVRNFYASILASESPFCPVCASGMNKVFEYVNFVWILFEMFFERPLEFDHHLHRRKRKEFSFIYNWLDSFSICRLLFSNCDGEIISRADVNR